MIINDKVMKLLSTPGYPDQAAYEAQYMSLSTLHNQNRDAYTDTEINSLILRPYSEDHISATDVMTHYADWVKFGLTPTNILFIAMKFDKKAIASLNSLISSGKKLSNLINPRSSIHQFQLTLNFWKLTSTSFITLLLKDNCFANIEVLRTLFRCPDDHRAVAQLCTTLSIGIAQLVEVISNIGVSRGIDVLQKLVRSVEETSVKFAKPVNFKMVLSILGLTLEQFMIILANVDGLRELDSLKNVLLWAKSACKLKEYLTTFRVNSEQLLYTLLRDKESIYLNTFKALKCWIGTHSSENRKEIVDNIYLILGMDLERLVKFLATIDNITNKLYSSLIRLTDVVLWMKQLSAGSSSNSSPQGSLARILAITEIDLEQLIKLFIYCSSKDIKTFKDWIHQAINSSTSVDELTDIKDRLVIFFTLEFKKIEQLEKTKQLNSVNDSTLDDSILKSAESLLELSKKRNVQVAELNSGESSSGQLAKSSKYESCFFATRSESPAKHPTSTLVSGLH